jgi:hypothetical protein
VLGGDACVMPAAFMPGGWPVAEPELLMGYVGSVMVVRIGGALSATDFARYLEEWTRAIDARPADAAVFTMYDMPEWPGMTGTQRNQWGAALKSREEKLRVTTRGMVLASPSILTRGGASTLFGIAPPSYPHAVVDAPAAAFAHIARRGGPPAAAAMEAYQGLVRQHWRASEVEPGTPGE